MRMSKQPYPLATLFGLRDRIDPTPDYQRPPAWTLKQKQLLIDTILRGYDIPKMYWQRLPKAGRFEFAVIDGQQRLRTVWEYCAGDFALARNMDAVEGVEIKGKKYADLDFNLRSKFDIYFIDVVIVEDAVQNEEDDEVRDMFLRLQNGTTLKAQEKRNAMTGQMRDFVKEIAQHKFFGNCGFSNSRFAFDHLAAQIICLEIAGEPTSVRDSDLNRMYAENAKFDITGKTAKKVRRVLEYLLRAFPEKTPELERYNVITLYLLASSLVQNYVHAGTEELLANWFINFETERRKNENVDEEQRDSQLIEYRRLTSNSTDAEESIRGRLDFVEKGFFLANPQIETIDTIRMFTHGQRLAIFRRDEGRCKLKLKCTGDKLTWLDEWHADHILPHSKGGRTTVYNGQVACAACNLAKSNGVFETTL